MVLNRQKHNGATFGLQRRHSGRPGRALWAKMCQKQPFQEGSSQEMLDTVEIQQGTANNDFSYIKNEVYRKN